MPTKRLSFIHVSIGWDGKAFLPIKPVKLQDGACVHTPCPSEYVERSEWAEAAMKTHAQVRCPQCGLWAIWMPKAEARKVNKRNEQEAAALIAAYQHAEDERKLAEIKARRRTTKARK